MGAWHSSADAGSAQFRVESTFAVFARACRAKGRNRLPIFVIRHGETAYNAGRIVQTPDVPLNARGLRQAVRLAKRLAAEGVDRIIASDYVRARLTADAVAQATGAPLVIDPLLRERNFGEMRGRPHDEIGDLYAADLEPPGGESWAVFHERVDQAWQRLTQDLAADERIAVVTHGLVCFSLALRQWSLPTGAQARRDFRNTSVTVVGGTPPWTVQRLNCCEHLRVGDEAVDAAAV